MQLTSQDWRAVVVAVALSCAMGAEAGAQAPAPPPAPEAGQPDAAGDGAGVPPDAAQPPAGGKKILGQSQKERLIAKCSQRPPDRQARCFTGL